MRTDGGSRVLVVVSHYNMRTPDQLLCLIKQLGDVPAGLDFDVRVVVNRARDAPLGPPDQFEKIDILHRENVGYNIGAWEAGWRAPPHYDFYVFLQEECVILKAGWLRSYVGRLRKAGAGAVGERLNFDFPWEDLRALIDRLRLYGAPEPPPEFTVDGLLEFINRHGGRPQSTARHLQTLVLAARREVLEEVGGFEVGRDKAESIYAEIAFSQKVLTRGYRLEQASPLAFRYVLHPQWTAERVRDRAGVGPLRALVRSALPGGIKRQLGRLRSRGDARPAVVPGPGPADEPIETGGDQSPRSA